MDVALRVVRPGFDPELFFESLRRISRRVLLLDYDGTLSALRPERDQAYPYPGVREALAQLIQAGRTRVVIVTGRAVHDLVPLLGLHPPPEIWGCHGWEHLGAGGHYEPPPLTEQARHALEAARDTIKDLPVSADRCEMKPASLAFHLRGLAAETAVELRHTVQERWNAIARETGLQLHPFDGGVELRIPGRDKGSVVKDILDQSAEMAAAYLGDDLTDEDAFRAMHGRGMGVLVRTQLRPTAADVWIRPPEELLAFFARWQREATGDR